LTDTCFRQIEFAGVVNGTKNQEAAENLIDFMLSNTFQQDIPNSMLMFPASNEAELPATFAEFAEVVEDPYMLDPEIIERNRNNWTERWTQIVLR
jgi:thiamine transport system substrate-binding protein